MKLRQKLAMVLATAMVVTAVPVTTMAATSNTLTNTVTTIKGETLGYTKEEAQVNNTTGSIYAVKEKAPKLTLTFTENHTQGEANNETAFVSIENGSFTNEAFLAALLPKGENLKVDKDGRIRECSVTNFNGEKPEDAVKLPGAVLVVDVLDETGTATGVKVEVKKAGSQFRLTIKASGNNGISKGNYVVLPLYVKAGEKDNIVTVDGRNSIISSGKFSLTNGTEIGTKALTATVGTTTVVTAEEGGKIADITLTENVIGKLAGQVVEIKLPHSSDLEFYMSEVKAIGGRAYAGKEEVVTVAYGKDSKDRPDYQTIEVTLPNWVDANATGTVKLSGIYVGPEDREDAALGDVTVTIKGDNVTTLSDIKVAEVKDYAVGLVCAEPAKIVAGKQDGTVKFKLTEDVRDTMVRGRKVEFTFENGFIGIQEYDEDTNRFASARATFDQLVKDEKITLPEKLSVTDVIANDEGQIVGFEVVVKEDWDKAASYEFKVPVMTAVENTEDVKVKAEGRAIGGELEAVTIATVTAPIEVEMETATLKAGLNGQVAGKVVITETDKNMLDKGWLRLHVDAATGISFDKKQDLNIKAEGLKVDEDSIYVGSDFIEFKVSRVSKEAASISIEGIKFNVDRTAPEGSFDMAIYGEALSENVFRKEGQDKFPVEDFIVITTKNTEDIQDASKQKEVVLAVNSKTYKVDGVEKTAEVAPFIDENNRTMVPLRLVSEEFGAKVDYARDEKGVATITIYKEGTTLQFKNGSKTMNKNGIQIPMDTAAVIKDNVTYVPFKFVAQGLNAQYEFNAELKTITFKN